MMYWGSALSFCKLSRLNGMPRFIRFHSVKMDLSPHGNTEEDVDYLKKVKQGLTKGLPILHHQHYVCDHPHNHQFKMRKFHKVLRYLRSDDVISMKQVIEPNLVSQSTASLAHDAVYIDRFFNGNTSTQEQRRTGFKWSEGLVRRCRYETGGTVLGCEVAMETGLACSTGGGTHHAFSGYGSGYCLINDIAIATMYALDNHLATRVLIIDLDVHQGDGTADIFKDREDVFTFSMHCGSNFPHKKQTSDLDISLEDGMKSTPLSVRKLENWNSANDLDISLEYMVWSCKKTGIQRSDLDISLEDGMKDLEYMKTLQAYLPTIIQTFNPNLVIYDAGVDPHERDELGRLTLTDKGLFERDFYVIDSLVSLGIPVVTVIGGGYCKDVDELGCRHTIVHRAASKIWRSRLSTST